MNIVRAALADVLEAAAIWLAVKSVAIRPARAKRVTPERPGGWRCTCRHGEAACDPCVYALMRAETFNETEAA